VTYVPATLTIGAEPGGKLVASTDVFNVVEDCATTTLDVLANDVSLLGSPITIVVVGTPSAGGTVAISSDGQRLIYSPAVAFFGEESLQYTIRNGNLTRPQLRQQDQP
jgi:hypothetical protein